MGSSSRSNSRQDTTNNNISTTFGVQGDNNGFITNGDGNSYYITQSDYGAMDAAIGISRDAMDMVHGVYDGVGLAHQANIDAGLGMVQGGFDLAENLNADALNAMSDTTSEAMLLANDANYLMADLAGFSINQNSALAGLSIDAQNSLALDAMQQMQYTIQDTLDYGQNSLAVGADLVARTNNNAFDLAENFMAFSGDAAYAVAEQSREANLEAQAQLGNTTKSLLQMAEGMTRSDGQQLALNSNKTLMFIAGSAAVAIVAVMVIKSKK